LRSRIGTFETLGEAQDHLAARLRAPGLEKRDVARRDLGVHRELELRKAPALAPFLELLADVALGADIGATYLNSVTQVGERLPERLARFVLREHGRNPRFAQRACVDARKRAPYADPLEPRAHEWKHADSGSLGLFDRDLHGRDPPRKRDARQLPAR
jgi:hypothetical protein